MPAPVMLKLTAAQKAKVSRIKRRSAALGKRNRAAGRIGRFARRWIGRRRQLVPYNRRFSGPRVENKLLGTNDINPLNANGIPGVAPYNTNVYWKGYCLCDVPAAWTSGLVNLGGMEVTQGVTAQQRVGSYVKFLKTTLHMEIATQFSSTGKPPMQFRVLVVKANQKRVPAGSTDAPGATLFLDNIGQSTGIASSGGSAMTSFEYHNNLVNKRDWIVYRDQRFTLSHPARSDSDGGYIGYSGRYPIKKNFKFSLNHFRNTRISPANNLPQDYDGHYLVMIFASNATADTGAADQWKITMRGTTSYNDN